MAKSKKATKTKAVAAARIRARERQTDKQVKGARTDEDSTLLTRGIEEAIHEAVKRDPEAITPVEKALENEAEAAANIELHNTPEGDTHAVVLTGGIDSTVLLFHIRKTIPTAKIVPVMAQGTKASETVKPFLAANDVRSQVSLDMPKLSIDTKEKDWREFFEQMREKKIYIIHFPANHDEAEAGIAESNFPFYQTLNDIARDYDVQVSTPFQTVGKDKIIQMAVDLYDIHIEELAKPRTPKQDLKDRELSDEEFEELSKDEQDIIKSEKVRREGFKRAFSLKYQEMINDPFAPEPEKGETAASGGTAEGKTPGEVASEEELERRETERKEEEQRQEQEQRTLGEMEIK